MGMFEYPPDNTPAYSEPSYPDFEDNYPDNYPLPTLAPNLDLGSGIPEGGKMAATPGSVADMLASVLGKSSVKAGGAIASAGTDSPGLLASVAELTVSPPVEEGRGGCGRSRETISDLEDVFRLISVWLDLVNPLLGVSRFTSHTHYSNHL